jgi:muramoyltetrapeptide carboxypeptidase LdcA involved in peptidoglycan recycling
MDLETPMHDDIQRHQFETAAFRLVESYNIINKSVSSSGKMLGGSLFVLRNLQGLPYGANP